MIKPTPKNREDFQTLVELAMRTEGYLHMRAVIEKELLHYDLLFALDKYDLLDKLTFQGGTSLRLCYGAPRLSEDLDFCRLKNQRVTDGGHPLIFPQHSLLDDFLILVFTPWNTQNTYP